ncbi:diaminopimelate epimerase [Pullulanibacillus camelliae]|nr:diaminopimelate epimerase [Pullulanibacillus camelliae]
MHGLGNNYIYLDMITNTYTLPPYPQFAQRLADQSRGIGSDGMILLLPSETADIQMRIFNKDGSEAKNCGNGLRCVAKYAFDNQLVSAARFTIETLGGLVEAEVIVDENEVSEVTVDMGEPRLLRGQIPMQGNPTEQAIQAPIQLKGTDYQVTAVSMGNPHAIFFVEDIQETPIHTLGPLLADGHELFPEGANVGFVESINEQSFAYRVWERGSGITQACGTGACAAAVAAIVTERGSKDVPITIHLAGGDLTIVWESKTNHILMTGPAVTICTGTFYL